MKKILSTLLFVLIISFVFVGNTNTAVITNDKQHIMISKGLVPPNPEVYNDPTIKTGSRDDRKVVDVSDNSNLSKAPKMESISEKTVSGSTQKVLMIPIAFTDLGFDVDEETFQSHLLSLGEELTDYYESNSGYIEGVSGITLDCTASSVVTSQHTMSYYGEDNLDIDDANIDISELAREAVELLDAKGFDFTEYDQNNDGEIDNLFIIHAGQGQEEATNSDLIWSHHWAIEGGELVDSILANEYIMIPETAQLGVIAHEYGHTVGLPDLYDTNGPDDGITNGIGRWGIMGDGSWNHLPNEPAGSSPSNLCAWSKIYLGWEKAEDITSNKLKETLNNTDGQSQILRVWPSGNMSSKEYFLVEYRRCIGYDLALPGEGVLIWHVDQEMIDARFDTNLINADESRLGLELEQADGLFDMWWLKNYGDDTDPFGGNSHNNNFMALPYGLNYSNIKIDDKLVQLFADILNIEINDDTATADIYVNESNPTQAPALIGPENDDETSTQPVFDWDIVPQAEYYVLQIAEDENFTQNLTADIIFWGSSTLDYLGDYFSYKLSEDNALNYNTQYYWRICAANDLTEPSVNAVWSETRELKSISAGTGTVPDAAPADITFSFDGDNANKLMGSDTTMEYSLNGGINYSPVSVANQKLTLSEVNNLDATSDLLVRYKATSKNSASDDCVIDILAGPAAIGENYTLIWNDNNNIIHGLTDSYEYRNGQDWYTYNGSVLGIEGDCQISFRLKATGTTLPGDIYTINFTTVGYIKDGFDMNFNVFEFVFNDDDSICYLSVSDKNTVYVLNMVTGAIDEINFTYMPEHLAYYDNNLYVTLVENDSRSNFKLAAVDTSTNTISTSTEIADDPSDLVIDRNGNIFVPTYNSGEETITLYELGTEFTVVDDYNMVYPGKKIVVNPTSDLIYSFVAMDNDEVELAVISYQNGEFNGDYVKYDGVNLVEDFMINSTGDTLINGSGQVIQAPQSIDDNGSVLDNLGYTFTECYVLDDKYYLLVNGNDIDVLDLLNGSYLETFSFYYDLQQLFTIGNNIYSLEIDTTTGLNYFRVFEKPIPVPDISFSFDGDNAGKLLGSTTSMEYSIDGGKKYYAVAQDDMLLNATTINSITAVNDIRVRFAETETTSASQDKVIDIQAGPSVYGVSANDSDNTLSGMTNLMEFSINDGSTWTSFNNNLPSLTGNVTMLVRMKARGVALFGAVSRFTFTAPQPSGGGSGGGGVPVVMPPAELPVVPTEPVIKEVELDTLSDQFNDSTTTNVVIGMQSETDKGISVDGDIFKQLKDANKDLEIDGDVIDIVVPADAFDNHNTNDAKMELYYDELTSEEVDKAIANAMDDVGGLFAVGDRIFEFHADLISGTETEEVTAFNSELTMTITLTKEDIAGIDPDKLGVYYYNEKSGEWEYVGGVYDAETNTLTFKTNHFSFYTIMQYNKTFDDIKNHWARDYIEKMASKHITEGKSDTTFDPDSNTTRAEYVALIVRALGLKDDGIKTINYDDVDESKWYHSDINTAYDKGILRNMVSFNPEVEITREDMMFIIVDAMKISGNYISVEASEVDEILAPYSDSDKIARGNREAVALAIKNGLISGRTQTTLVPDGTATRAETMVVVSRLLDLIH